MPQPWDCVIVGGGPAGLAAALLLGRARRWVLQLDSGEYRNAAAHHLNGFITRDGTPPGTLRSLAATELDGYPTVQRRAGRVTAARRDGAGFALQLAGEPGEILARRLLLATGLVDALPALPGLAEVYGGDAWHCPYCDAYEQRDQPLAVLGAPPQGLRMALELAGWTRDLVYCTGGPALEPRHRARLAALGIGLREEPVTALAVQDGRLQGLQLARSGLLPRRGLALAVPFRQRSELAQQLGCGLSRAGLVRSGRHGATAVRGLHVAGDMTSPLHLAVQAAAQGSSAGFGINASLLRDDLAARQAAATPARAAE